MLCTQNSVIVITFRYILVLDMTMVVKMTILVATDDYLSGFHGNGIVPTMHPQYTKLYHTVPHCTHLHHIVPTMHYIVPHCTKCCPHALHYTHNAPTMHHIVPTRTTLYPPSTHSLHAVCSLLNCSCPTYQPQSRPTRLRDLSQFLCFQKRKTS